MRGRAQWPSKLLLNQTHPHPTEDFFLLLFIRNFHANTKTTSEKQLRSGTCNSMFIRQKASIMKLLANNRFQLNHLQQPMEWFIVKQEKSLWWKLNCFFYPFLFLPFSFPLQLDNIADCCSFRIRICHWFSASFQLNISLKEQ